MKPFSSSHGNFLQFTCHNIIANIVADIVPNIGDIEYDIVADIGYYIVTDIGYYIVPYIGYNIFLFHDCKIGKKSLPEQSKRPIILYPMPEYQLNTSGNIHDCPIQVLNREPLGVKL